MPNNAILALFHVLSEISMAFSRPGDLATLAKKGRHKNMNRNLVFYGKREQIPFFAPLLSGNAHMYGCAVQTKPNRPASSHDR